ncbi:MAG: putative Zn finger protein [Verrucomicrobiales bacterium]|jgi:uncharacterized Zn finger protein
MSRYDYGGGWAPYVPVAQRRANGVLEMQRISKKGKDIQPVKIEGRTIAKSFWGKGWCDHLDSFGDISNRLPRGRTYARNGSVCHLEIKKGAVEAYVAGSELYEVSVEIAPLKQATWNQLKKDCTGKIGSLIELLQGRLSDEVMTAVTNREKGLFPKRREIQYECDCPDWAGMCKHIAAVMCGIGARLDTQPELLFVLRGVDHDELITADAAAGAIAGGGSRSRRGRRRTLAADDLENVFGVELEEAPKARPKAKLKRGKRKVARSSKATFKPTGKAIAGLRKKHGLSKAAFARAVGVSPPTVANWEKASGIVRPQDSGLAGLKRLHEEVN